MTIQLMKEMFSRMVVKKDASQAIKYYHPDFVLETNGQLQNYADFLAGHQRVYGTAITYAVRYDEDSWVESGNKVAARLWITTQRTGEVATEIEVVLIATYSGTRILHLLELTWPDWTRVKALESY